MNTLVLRTLAALLVALGAARRAEAIFGVADTSFVTVIANPAEAANWAAEIERLGDQLAAARETLGTVEQLRAYAGDPKAAVGELRDLGEISDAIATLSSDGQTDADFLRAWQAAGAPQRASSAAELLQSSGAGATMQVFGQPLDRDPSLYTAAARDADASGRMRGQIAGEQSARASIASELALAWNQFRSAGTESEKQAVLAEISQLQSQNQVLDTRRRAILDDFELADRQSRNAAGVREKAADEGMLAESALLNSETADRARAAEAQRLATLQKAAPTAAAPDYSGMKLWTTADGGGP
ncbi:MAG TPA: hypothetical protein VII09_03560 [Opitutaceae bacterium]